MRVCAFTGHRNLYEYDFDGALLRRVILNLVKNGVNRFLCGMAVGFDLEAAQAVLELKGEYDIQLVACLPCLDQSVGFSARNKKLYNEILSACDETVLLGNEYTRGCMLRRDRYLVDNCDVLVSFLRRNRGGTHYTVGYARAANKKIIEL